MSHIAPPPARSRHSQTETNGTANTKPARAPQKHPLPANPMHHQGFIKQQVKSAHQHSHGSMSQQRYSDHAHSSQPHSSRYPPANASGTLQPFSNGYGGSTTGSSAASGSSSMYSALSSSSTQPSPATSTTSSITSSLRTPPDFLMQGGTSLHKSERSPKVYLSIAEIDQRLKLLDSLASDLTPVLPPEPGSRRGDAVVKAREDHDSASASSASRSKAEIAKDYAEVPPRAEPLDAQPPRKRQSDADGELPSFRKKVKRPIQSESDKLAAPAASSSRAASATQASPMSTVSALPAREWSKQEYTRTGTAYQAIGRALKHSADRRSKERLADDDDAGSSRKSRLTALYEQTEAILCFAYAFWCEDQASAPPRSCITANWSSLLGLLHYNREKHDKHGHTVFAGLCRFLEALVLQHLANHEKRFVQEQLTNMAAAEQDGDQLPSSLPQLSASMNKALVDEDASRQLFVQARGMLSSEVLSEHFPDVWTASTRLRSTPPKAKDVDPSSVDPSGRPSSDPLQAQWAWPMDSTISFPHVVCFGRALLREGAQRSALSYQLSKPL